MHCLTTQDCTSLPPALLAHANTCLGCNFTLIEASFSAGPCISHQHVKRAVITWPHRSVPAHLPALSQKALRCVLCPSPPHAPTEQHTSCPDAGSPMERRAAPSVFARCTVALTFGWNSQVAAECKQLTG